MTKNALVTGANGFIGQHLCRSLLDDGFKVRGMLHEHAPLYFVEEDEIEWVTADLRVKETLQDVCSGIDTVFHLAAIPRNDLSKSWDEFLEVNVRGTERLLCEGQKAKIGRFVFISTVEAAGYGDGINPRKETDEPHPDNYYGKSKLAAEGLVLSADWPFERVVLRLPMVYGPGTFLIVPKLFGMAKRGFYPLFGSGDTLMEFSYVGNAVHGMRLAAEKKEAVGQLFYVSDERSYTIREVVSGIAEAMGRKVIFIRIPVWIAYAGAFVWELMAKLLAFPPIVSRYSKKPFFTRETVWWTTRNVNTVDQSKAKSLIEYRPEVSRLDGCQRTWSWLNSVNGGPL
jgi:UDP-glucose 4-epimerase